MNCSMSRRTRKLVNRIHLTQNGHYHRTGKQAIKKCANARRRTTKIIYRIIIKGKLRENICISIILFLSVRSVVVCECACVYDIESLDLHNTFLIQSRYELILWRERSHGRASIQKSKEVRQAEINSHSRYVHTRRKHRNPVNVLRIKMGAVDSRDIYFWIANNKLTTIKLICTFT